MTRVYARNGGWAFINEWLRASRTRMRRHSPRMPARGLVMCLLLSAGLLPAPVTAQAAGMTGSETPAREVFRLQGVEPALGQPTPSAGQLRQIDLRRQDVRPPFASTSPVDLEGTLRLRPVGFLGWRPPKGYNWNMGANSSIENILVKLEPQTYTTLCSFAAPDKTAETLKPATTPLVPSWCGKGKTTGAATPRTSTPTASGSDALSRFRDYKRRCGRTIAEMGATIGNMSTTGFEKPDPNLMQRYLACSADWRDLPQGRREWMERRMFVIGIKPDPAANSILPCTGLALRPNLIVTARHCFFPQDRAGQSLRGVAPSSVRAYFMNPPGMYVQARELLDEDGTSLTAHFLEDYAGRADIAFIKLAMPLDLGPTTDAQVVAPMPAGSNPISDLIVAGFHGELSQDLDAQIERGGGNAVRYDNSGGCMMVRHQNAACYAHTCQTGPGVSGAPILQFLEDADGLHAYLLGIHTGSGDAKAMCHGIIDKGFEEDWSRAAVNLAEFPVGKLFEK